MDKYKIVGKLRQLFFGSMAVVMSAGGVVATNMANAFAADQSLDNNVGVAARKLQYDDTESYVSKNVNKKVVTSEADKSTKEIKNDLTETGYSIRLKQLIAEQSKIPKDCTVDTLWAKYKDAFIAQYSTIVKLYNASDDADYYVANLSSAKINGMGSIYDAAFVKGTNNANPNVIKDIKFDKKTGLAYIPKSYFEKNKNVLITGQVMYGGSINNQTIAIDTTVDNGGEVTKQSVEANAFDVTVKVPITTSKKMAEKLKMSDFKVFLNGSETEMNLDKDDTATFNKSTGVLELAVSPSTLTSIRVEIKKVGAVKSVARFFTKDVSASVKNPDQLKFVTDKKTGNAIILDRIDPEKLKDGQVFEYKSSVRYFSKLSDMEVDYNAKASAEAIRHSIHYLYLPTGSANSGWFDVYDKGSDFSDQDGVNQKTNFEDVTFGMALPNSTSKYKATTADSKKVKLDFHMKGSFTTKYTGDDASYSSKHMFAGECAHITNPMGSFKEGETAKLRLSVLHVDRQDQYVIIGINTQEVNTQSGFGIYKLKFEYNKPGNVYVKKTSTNPSMTNGSGCYSFKGAKFGLYKDAACTDKEATLTADENGNTQVEEVDTGKYYVKEITAPTGYEKDDKVYTVNVTEDNDEDHPAVVTIADQPKDDPVNFEVKKVDKETGETVQGDASLAGAEFTVKFYNNFYNSASDLPSKATKTWVLQTKKLGNKYALEFRDQYKVSGDSFYMDSNGTPVVPWGTLTIEETKAPDGYKIKDSTVSVNGQVLSNRIYFTRVSDKDGEQPSKVVTDFTVSDPAKKYGIQVWKVDKELDKSEAIGGKDHKISETGTTLEGVQFSIINRSATAIKYGDKTVNPGEEVTKITTSWNSNLKKYTAQTDERTLPYGTYGVQEISSSQGYKMTDGTEKTVVCHGADGTMYTPDLDANLKFPNQVFRGDYSVRKKSDEGKSISAAFKVTNEATGETHVIVTDKNGEFDSTDNKHSKNTNANDKLLKGYTKNTVLKSSDFDLDAGVWFGQGEDGSVAKADDSLGAFYYGKYKIEELRSDSNKGLKLISTDFTITKDGKKINAGTLTDESEPSIGTKAKDEATGTNVASATDDVTIIDTVNYEHLDRGKYKLTAVLMDKATKAAILDKDGKEVTASKVFSNTTKSGTVDVEININAAELSLAGKDVVVFETLTSEADGTTIAVHHDINDEGQTIKFPEIKTKASDATTGSNIVEAKEDMKIKDTVSYKNLIKGKTYTIIGKLMDKETGKVVLDDDGKEVTASVKFTADAEDGTVDVIFEFSGVKTAGKKIVAFETLEYKGKEYAVHADINDNDQTVLIPKVSTTASDKNNGTHMSYAGKDVTIVDKVEVKNIVAGREYTLKGKVMDKKTGNPLLVDGKEITAEKTFKANGENETVELEFTFDASALKGTTTVVFENLYEGENEIGTHADLEDEGQTVEIPEIGTTLIGKDSQIHVINADEKITLVDTVKYKGLEKGREYKVDGVLYDKETKQPLEIDGKQVTASATFTAEASEGSVDVTFEFNGSDLAGKTLVAFEEAYDVETNTLVADHKDIDDGEQTVVVPKIGTTLTDKDGNKTVNAAKETVLVDTVKYENLEVGREVELKGILYDKNTQKPIMIDGKEVTASAKFTPEEASGTAQVEFKFDATSIAGKTAVAFEEAYDVKTGTLIGSHKDIDDSDQTVNFPELHTTATDKADGDHTVNADKKVTIVDTVKYKNVTPNKELEVSGTLYDKDTKKPVKVNGKEVAATAKFTPKEANGEVKVSFTFDASKLGGYSLVAFEKMLDVETGAVIGTHEDITDKDQTVKVKGVKKTPKTTSHTSTPGSGSSSSSVKTGQKSIVPVVIGLIVVVVAGGAAFVIRKKQKGDKEQ